jgi:hypothetical protein
VGGAVVEFAVRQAVRERPRQALLQHADTGFGARQRLVEVLVVDVDLGGIVTVAEAGRRVCLHGVGV